MPLVRGPHQRRRTAERFLRVRVRAVVEQRLHRLDVAGARGEHQRRPAERKRLVGIGPGLDEGRDHPGVAVHTGQPQRRHALTVRRLRIGTRTKQDGGQVPVASVHGPMERGRPIGLRGVHVDLLRDQRLHGRRVTTHRRIGDVALTGRRRGHGGHQSRHDDHEDGAATKDTKITMALKLRVLRDLRGCIFVRFVANWVSGVLTAPPAGRCCRRCCPGGYRTCREC